MSVLLATILVMGRLILTGLTKSAKHEFKLRYEGENEAEHCWVDCKCGFSIEVVNFRTYGGIKEVEKIWTKHTGLK